MPAQQRLGADYVQGVSPSTAQSGQDGVAGGEQRVHARARKIMNEALQFNNLLVPVDFSAASAAAVNRALALASDGDQPVLILLHVVDTTLVDFAENHGWGSKGKVSSQMREQADAELQRYREI